MTASPLAQKATDAFNAPICETDPEIAELLDSELGRQRSGLEMIASENFVPRAVLQCQGSVLTNKYAEGYPGRFYHAEAYGVNPETFRTDPEIIRQRTLDGAKILAERLLADDVKANGISVLTGGTDVHLVMVDLRNSEMDGQQGEDLLPALAVCHLCQHSEGHVDVDGGADLVLSAAAGEQLGDDGAEVAVQHVRIALRLIRLLSAVCLPCVINLIETVAVKVSVGSAELGLVRVRRHLGILRGGQLVFADGFGLGLRAGGQGNQTDRGKEKSEDPFHEKHLHLKK